MAFTRWFFPLSLDFKKYAGGLHLRSGFWIQPSRGPPLPVTRFMAHRTEATSKSAAGPLVANLDVNNSQFDADWQSWCAPSAPAQDEAMEEYHGTHGPMGDAPDYSIQGDFTYHFLDD